MQELRSFWKDLERVVQTHLFSIVSELRKADPDLSLIVTHFHKPIKPNRDHKGVSLGKM